MFKKKCVLFNWVKILRISEPISWCFQFQFCMKFCATSFATCPTVVSSDFCFPVCANDLCGCEGNTNHLSLSDPAQWKNSVYQGGKERKKENINRCAPKIIKDKTQFTCSEIDSQFRTDSRFAWEEKERERANGNGTIKIQTIFDFFLFFLFSSMSIKQQLRSFWYCCDFGEELFKTMFFVCFQIHLETRFLFYWFFFFMFNIPVVGIYSIYHKQQTTNHYPFHHQILL